LTFLADECVAESACKFLEERGHEVIRAKDRLPEGTQDPIVAKVAEDLSAILLSDDSDFATIAARRQNRQKIRFRKLSRVHLACKHSQAVNRLAAAITLIEFEYELAQARADKRMIVEVKPTLIRTLR
jgi:predicted nuclease of predicted toxin-antitoxin system